MAIKDSEVERLFVEREKELITGSGNFDEILTNIKQAFSLAASEEVMCAAVDHAFGFSCTIVGCITVCKALAKGSLSQTYAISETLKRATTGDDYFAIFFAFPETARVVVQKVLENNYTISPEHLGFLCQSRLIGAEQKQVLLKKLEEALAEKSLLECLQAHNYVTEMTGFENSF